MKRITLKPQFAKSQKDLPHRVHDWIDINTLDIVYGVQTKIAPRTWAHVVEQNELNQDEPIIFKTKEEALNKIKELTND